LKHYYTCDYYEQLYVAPYTGAWIETTMPGRRKINNEVAPYTGAWIETVSYFLPSMIFLVAPYTGAWIETAML